MDHSKSFYRENNSIAKLLVRKNSFHSYSFNSFDLVLTRKGLTKQEINRIGVKENRQSVD